MRTNEEETAYGRDDSTAGILSVDGDSDGKLQQEKEMKDRGYSRQSI